MIYRAVLKRTFDILGAAAALLLLSPVLIVVAAAVALRIGRPVLFVQQRTGRHGRPFGVLKFRTMTDARDADGRLLPDDARLTSLGRRLRAWSLDELPQLLNVLRGQMSLVGPRPLLHKYLNRYSDAQLRRFEGRPGITGWAQVNGRNALDWQRKLELDVEYVDRCSLWLDLVILLRTVGKVLSRTGIDDGRQATAAEFQGNGVAVLGAGGHAKVVIRALQLSGQYVRCVYDDDPQRWGERLLGVPVAGPLRQAIEDQPARAVLAIGDNQLRRRLAIELDLNWTAAVHPRACIDETATIEPGAVVCAGAVVQADAVVGAHAIVNTGASVDHDCHVGEFSHLGPRACLAGHVRMETGCLAGAGSVVLPGVVLGAFSVLGAGSVALSDVPAGETAVGSPAQPIRQRRAA